MQLRSRLVMASALIIGLASSACRPSTDGAQASPRATTVQAALDTCNADRFRSSSHDTVTEVGTAATRVTGAIHTFRTFSLFIPDSARITTTDNAAGLTLAWPRCPACRFSVRIASDSGVGVEARIARIVADQKRIDSANAVDSIGEFNEIDDPPHPFTTASGRGYEIDNDCGDCAATGLLFGRPGYIATIDFGGDDDVPKLGRYLCEMSAVGKSFAWRE